MLLAIRRRLLGAGCGDYHRDNNEGGTTNFHTAADLVAFHALCEIKLPSHSLGVSAVCLIAPCSTAHRRDRRLPRGRRRCRCSIRRALRYKGRAIAWWLCRIPRGWSAPDPQRSVRPLAPGC